MCSICRQFGLSDRWSEDAVQSANVSSFVPQQTTTLPAAGSSGVGDSLYPGFGNGGYDVQHYTLDLNVTDVATSALTATTTIEATATQALSSFNLDFIGFAIEGITVNGQAATFTRDGQELTITPTEALGEGETFTVEVDYSGSPTPTNSAAFDFPVPTGWVLADNGSFVLSEPDGAANFYPVNDHPLDRASYTFRITVPENFDVAANGVLEQEIDNGTTTTYLFEARDPMVSYLTTINIFDGFQRQSEVAPNGVVIRNYFDEDVSEELLTPFQRQSEMMGLFSSIFGPYPFEVYGSVVVNAETGSALETQTLSIFGVDMLGDNESTEETIAHELAHQWFGDSLALSDWKDIWLNESFATYAQALWVEYDRGGQEALNSWVTDQYNYIARRFDTVYPPGAPPANNLFNAGVYEWGALGLHALRLEIGTENFLATLRNYFTQFEGKNVTPADFLTVAETTSNEQLDNLFERWFYSPTLASIPELNLFAGTSGSDRLVGSSANETLTGLSGNDKIYGRNGNNSLFGNAGNDQIYGGVRVDTVYGGDGNDQIYGKSGLNVLNGNAGDDLIYGGYQADEILGGTGNDTIHGKGGGDTINSGDGVDVIWLGQSRATVTLAADSGYDTIHSFRLGATRFQVSGSRESLSFTNINQGVQVFQGTDLLAVVRNQTADTFSRNLNKIFVA
ncbi:MULTISPECIES: M1 family aminopeptidase [unclassified Leptolyngbya]|uniref:M1 family aminopeptidase n=1 Tax=unclassified Leptolyngbya TaxID=2650499 RepID=UPI00168A2417|nr:MULTISPECIES: M1 family aminopeptidase [unclassified Leptolyngbya]MBD1910750.1 hypothetical protein [Leptolyngbya sp. FACHB-8]MBD2158231.1 hypothetical protein [Leptolyngbya sp. FACHB-16]